MIWEIKYFRILFILGSSLLLGFFHMMMNHNVREASICVVFDSCWVCDEKLI